MAKSRFEYVKNFENNIGLLRNTWIVIRVDGKGFSKFVKEHEYTKPNDIRGIDLMSRCASRVMLDFPECVLAFGHSDEFSFVLPPDCKLYSRREAKLVSSFASGFSSSFVFYWKEFFDQELQYPPVFDARAVCYPTDQNLRDYLSWRQADCHINNLYNVCFWKLVHDGSSCSEAEEYLRGTVSAEKNELLFSRFDTNYNDTSAVTRRGSTLVYVPNSESKKPKRVLLEVHEDLIGNSFWKKHPEILNRSRRC